MKKLIIFLLLHAPLLASAHDGEEHGDAKGGSLKSATYFSSEAVSAVYELLIKYTPLPVGKEGVLQLFVSDFNSNSPVDSSATLRISVADNPNIKLTISRIDKGIYEIKGVFPEKKAYNLNVNINTALGPDLLLLSNINVGKELLKAETVVVPQNTVWYKSNLFYGFTGLLLGLISMFLLMKKTNKKVIISLVVLICILPTATYHPAAAHGGEDHNEGGGKAGGVLSSAFMVEKESQFLFDVITQKIETGNFNQFSQALGTVIASPQGNAVVQSPQTGKITSLKVNPGQFVNAGQVIAVVEQSIDAGTQSSIAAQNSDWEAKRNEVEAQYNAAKTQYNRLKDIEDIAAKKDVTEAKARLEQAEKNKDLYQNIPLQKIQSAKYFNLTSPISGVVGTFNYAVGSFINSGETLLEVTNLNKIFVEIQVFANDAAQLKAAERITTTANMQSDTTIYTLKIISAAQSVNGTNQSQKVIFEIINPKGQFKIGENINVRIFSKNVTTNIIVPNEAVTEINGKAVVFIKDRAEQFSVNYISKGAENDRYTTILKGVEPGERVVVRAVYQMKSIYLNQ